jgi:hypothetical protein
MESAKVIFTTRLSGYRPVIWLGEAVYKRELQIRAILRDRLGEEYCEMFSQTVLHSGSHPSEAAASWRSGYISEGTPINRYSGDALENLRARLSMMMEKITSLCAELKTSENVEYRELSELIQLALVVPSEDCILVSGDRIVLVLWGFISDTATYKPVELIRFVSKIEKKPEEAKIQITQNPPPEPERKEEVKTVSVSNPPSNPVSPAESGMQKVRKKCRCRRWWWVGLIALGLALLVLLFFLLFKSCRHFPVLPDRPEILLPIDTSKIISNPGDTLHRPVVGNRLNVILDKNANMDAFAKSFSDRFGQDARIIYYDTMIMQVQIEFYKEDIPYWKKKLKELPEVKIVFEESIFHSGFTPTDPGFSDAQEAWAFKAIRAYEAWDQNRGNSKIVIAVLDDGFDMTHPEFAGRMIRPWNVISRDALVGTNGGRNKHGTHVAALVAGNINNGKGVSGVAPQCMIMPVQISDANGIMSTTGIISGFLYSIKHGANVINMSLGMRWSNLIKNSSLQYQEELARTLYPEEAAFWDELYAYAEDYGVVVIQAAGNDEVLASIDPMKRSVKTIVVGSTDPLNAKSSFSNFGSRTDVSAPGTSIYSALPGNQYGFMEGTSMASPIVAGAAGLLLSVNPKLTPAEVKDILVQTGIAVKTKADQSMGPLIQLDKALEAAKKPPLDDCKRRTDSLIRVIRDLEKQIRK